jgi:hypothetical protein
MTFLKKFCVYALSLALIVALVVKTSSAQETQVNKATTQTVAPPAVPYFTEPSISPDRSEIAFVSGGDIWTVPAAGGEARLLVSHAANESRPSMRLMAGDWPSPRTAPAAATSTSSPSRRANCGA